MNTSSELFDGSCVQVCRSDSITTGSSRLYPEPGIFQNQAQILDSNFLLPLNGQIYDVSNLASSSHSKLKKPPPGPPRTSKKNYGSSLYPQDWNELLHQMEHANEGSLDRLKRNWNRRRHTLASPHLSTTLPMHQEFHDRSLKQPQQMKKDALPPEEALQEDQGFFAIRRSSCPVLPYQSMMSNDATTGLPQIALGGEAFPFYGAKETAQAISEGLGWNTCCQGCRAPLTCMTGVTYIICPGCKTIGPANSTQYDDNPVSTTTSSRMGPKKEDPTALRSAGIGLRQLPRSRTTAFAPLPSR